MSDRMDRWERMLVDMGSMLDRLEEKSNRTYRDPCDDVFNVGSRERRKHRNFRGDGVKSRMGGAKITIPQFKGRNDPEAYVAWEEKVELRFECHDCSGERKLRLVVSLFVDYAVIWWDQLTTSMRRCGGRSIETWDELRSIMRKRYAPNHFCRRDRQDQECREESRRYSGVGYSREEKTPSVEHVDHTSSRKTTLDYKLEFAKIRDLINSQNNHKKEQMSKRDNCEVISCKEKGIELPKNKGEVESEHPEGKVELQKEIEEEPSEGKKELEMSFNEKEPKIEEAVVGTNNSLPILNISVLQVTKNLIPEHTPTEIPPDPGIKLQLDFSYLEKIDFVIPEETKEFQMHWRNYICRGLTEKHELRDNVDTLEPPLSQVLRPSKARRRHGYSTNEVAIEALHTCKIKQSRRAHFNLCKGDWVYIQRRRVRSQRRFKLHPRGDGPFHVLELIGDKGYNLSNQVMDSRLNPFEGRGDDVIRGRQSLGRAMERARLKLTCQ